MRKVFVWGLAFSILVHLLIGSAAGLYKPPRFDRPESTQVVISRIHPIVIQTPKPTPKPSPPHPQRVARDLTKVVTKTPQRLRLNVPKARAVTKGAAAEQTYVAPPGSENGVPRGSGSGSQGAPGAGGTGGGSGTCDTPHVPAHVISLVTPDYPDSADQVHAYGTVLVAVTLTATGAVQAVAVNKSSGNLALDNAALNAARATQYAPDIVDCRAVGGTYIFRAIFDPQ